MFFICTNEFRMSERFYSFHWKVLHMNFPESVLIATSLPPSFVIDRLAAYPKVNCCNFHYGTYLHLNSPHPRVEITFLLCNHLSRFPASFSLNSKEKPDDCYCFFPRTALHLITPLAQISILWPFEENVMVLSLKQATRPFKCAAVYVLKGLCGISLAQCISSGCRREGLQRIWALLKKGSVKDALRQKMMVRTANCHSN